MESTKAVKEKKEPMTPKQKTLFVLKIIGNVIFYAVLILLFLISIANINSSNSGGLPNIFGKGFLAVETKSMEVAPTGVVKSSVKENYELAAQKTYLEEHGLLDSDGYYSIDYSKFSIGTFDDHAMVSVDVLNNDQKKNLSVGDVITFYDDNLKGLNTHRIVYVQVNEAGAPICYVVAGDKVTKQELDVYSGLKWAATYKDAHNMLYESLNYIDLTTDTGLSMLKGKVTSINGGMGDVLRNIKEYWLFYFVIPVAILLVIEVILVVKNIFDLRREKNKAIDLADHEAQMAELQSEKERMRQELLAELRAQGALPAEEPKQEAPTEEKVEEPEVTPVVEEKAPVEETPAEDTAEPEKVEEVKGETTEETPVEEKEEEKEPVVNDEALEPNMDIEENEEEK